jgi:hypothetical protein
MLVFNGLVSRLILIIQIPNKKKPAREMAGVVVKFIN